jgi:hypothetical protein
LQIVSVFIALSSSTPGRAPSDQNFFKKRD